MKSIIACFLLFLFTQFFVSAQDNIIMRNGEEIKAKVQEVGINEIKYKKVDNLTGPLYTVLKSEVFIIKYENGTKEVFGNAESEVPVEQQKLKSVETTPYVTNDYRYDRKKAIKKIVGGAIMTGLGVPVLITGVTLSVVGISSLDGSSGNSFFDGPSIGLITTGALITAGGIVLEVLGPITLSRGIKARRAAKEVHATINFTPINTADLDRYNYSMNHQTIGAVTFTF